MHLNKLFKWETVRQQVLVSRRLEAEPQGVALDPRMMSFIVALDKKDIQFIHPAPCMLLQGQIDCRDVDLDVGSSRGCRHIRRDRDLVDVHWSPDSLLESLLETCRFLLEDIASAVTQPNTAASCELYCDVVVLAVCGSRRGKAQHGESG